MMEAGRIYGVIAQETPLLHLERELVEMKYLTAGHKISANLSKSLGTRHRRSCNVH